MTEALEMVFKGLKLLGVDLPYTVQEQERAFLADIENVRIRVNKLPHISDLVNLPDCKDSTQLTIFKLYVIIYFITILFSCIIYFSLLPPSRYKLPHISDLVHGDLSTSSHMLC
jgi:hypothetical protein